MRAGTGQTRPDGARGGGGFESAATATTGAATLETHAVGHRAWTAVAIGAVDAGGPLTVDAYCRSGASKLKEATAR